MGRKPSTASKSTPAEKQTLTAPQSIEEPKSVDSVVDLHAVPDVVSDSENDDGLVAVRYFDGRALTFDMIHDNRKVSFVEGVARVDKALASELRKGGYIA